MSNDEETHDSTQQEISHDEKGLRVFHSTLLSLSRLLTISVSFCPSLYLSIYLPFFLSLSLSLYMSCDPTTQSPHMIGSSGYHEESTVPSISQIFEKGAPPEYIVLMVLALLMCVIIIG